MKVCTALVASALAVSSAVASIRIGELQQRSLTEQALAPWIDALTPIPNTDTFHMKPVRTIHARVQGDTPAWDTDKRMFTSAFGTTFAERFRAGLDTVNTASVEGALMYVQAEGINYAGRSEADRCTRKNKMKHVVFYDIVYVQPNETLALYEREWGPYLSMDSGQCTPVDAQGNFAQPCDYINGDNNEPRIGAFLGGELRDSDPRAPYPDTYWFSLPNTAVKQKWTAKNDTIRAATRRGLCDYDKLPDGITCTFNYRILGYVPIDDVVGITAMNNTAGTAKYANFSEFCNDGKVEFNGTVDKGVWQASIPFWLNPQDREENAKRAASMLTTYADMLTSRSSPQASATTIDHMTELPTIEELTATNPSCYENVKACGGTNGCKRTLFSQLCVECAANDTGCAKAPSNFVFPTLVKATGASGSTGNKDANGTTSGTSAPSTTSTPTPTPSTSGTPSPTSAAAPLTTGLATAAALALALSSFLLA